MVARCYAVTALSSCPACARVLVVGVRECGTLNSLSGLTEVHPLPTRDLKQSRIELVGRDGRVHQICSSAPALALLKGTYRIVVAAHAIVGNCQRCGNGRVRKGFQLRLGECGHECDLDSGWRDPQTQAFIDDRLRDLHLPLVEILEDRRTTSVRQGGTVCT